MEEQSKIWSLKQALETDKFARYERLFRELSCELNRNVPLKAISFSLSKLKSGLKVVYGGLANDHMANLIFKFFNRGIPENEHESIPFSKFYLNFITPLS